MSGVQPAVMYSPYDRNPASGQIVEQYLVVQKIAVDVVNVYDIRAYFVYLACQCPCGCR